MTSANEKRPSILSAQLDHQRRWGGPAAGKESLASVQQRFRERRTTVKGAALTHAEEVGADLDAYNSGAGRTIGRSHNDRMQMNGRAVKTWREIAVRNQDTVERNSALLAVLQGGRLNESRTSYGAYLSRSHFDRGRALLGVNSNEEFAGTLEQQTRFIDNDKTLRDSAHLINSTVTQVQQHEAMKGHPLQDLAKYLARYLVTNQETERLLSSACVAPVDIAVDNKQLADAIVQLMQGDLTSACAQRADALTIIRQLADCPELSHSVLNGLTPEQVDAQAEEASLHYIDGAYYHSDEPDNYEREVRNLDVNFADDIFTGRDAQFYTGRQIESFRTEQQTARHELSMTQATLATARAELEELIAEPITSPEAGSRWQRLGRQLSRSSRRIHSQALDAAATYQRRLEVAKQTLARAEAEEKRIQDNIVEDYIPPKESVIGAA